MSSNKQKKEVVDKIKSDHLTSIYFNEFAIGVSANDMFILLRRNGKEEVILNVSHITAKSLAISLNKAISDFEKNTNQKIMTSDELENLMEEEANHYEDGE